MSKGAYIGVPKPEYESAFADNSWAQIIKACQKNEVPSTWAVGNSKAMTINGADYLIDIIGKNHDTYSDGSGVAPLTFQLHDCYGPIYEMGDNLNGNSPGWTSCAMRTTYLPNILSLMPIEVQNGIKAVTKLTSKGNKNSTIEETSDKLFLLSESEVFDTISNSFSGEGNQYAYYAAGNSKVKYHNGDAYAWYLRSPWSGNQVSYCIVTSSGTAYAANAQNSEGVAFAFCFGGTSEVDSVLGGYGVARKVKKGYIGVPTEFPVYEESSTTITENNVAEFFDFTASSNGGFTFNGGSLDSATTTSFQIISSSTMTAKVDVPNLSFDYVVGSEGTSTPYLTVKVAGTEVVNATNAGTTGSWSGFINKGETIVLESKNKSTPSSLSNIVAVSQVQTGTETKDVARKIKKAYIGDENRLARLCFYGENPVYTERMLVYEDTNTLNFTDLPFEPKYFALETLGTIPSSSTIYVASIYADKESGLMRIVYKASAQSGFLQYTETYNGNGSFEVEWGKNSFYAYLVSYKLYSHATSGNPYQVTIWG